MRRLVLDHLEDIRDNAQAACEFVGAMTEAAFAADRKTLYAVLRALEVIGEAAKRVPAEVRGRVPFRIVTAQLPAIIERFAAVLAEERQLAGEASDPDDAAGEPST